MRHSSQPRIIAITITIERDCLLLQQKRSKRRSPRSIESLSLEYPDCLVAARRSYGDVWGNCVRGVLASGICGRADRIKRETWISQSRPGDALLLNFFLLVRFVRFHCDA